ncbi:TerB family tellurite resistance protein [Streptomyces oceani]
MRSRGGRDGPARVAGIRTRWHTVGDGDFFCPECGGDRGYRRRTGRRRFVLLGLPLLPRGAAATVVECAACRGHFGLEALSEPTTGRLSAMLRDATHSVVLAVLAAGGGGSRVSREAAVAVLRDAGYSDCAEDQLITLLAALEAERRPTAGEGAVVPSAAGVEVAQVLRPLAPHLAASGREALLLRGAVVALADGPYVAAEREVLETVGEVLSLRGGDIERLLATARTPS